MKSRPNPELLVCSVGPKVKHLSSVGINIYLHRVSAARTATIDLIFFDEVIWDDHEWKPSYLYRIGIAQKLSHMFRGNPTTG